MVSDKQVTAELLSTILPTDGSGLRGLVALSHTLGLQVSLIILEGTTGVPASKEDLPEKTQEQLSDLDQKLNALDKLVDYLETQPATPVSGGLSAMLRQGYLH